MLRPYSWYVHEGCGFKLFMQTFIYNFSTKKIGGVLRLTLMWYGPPFMWSSRNLILFKRRSKSQVSIHCSYFWEHLGTGLIVSRTTGWVTIVRVITLNVFQTPRIFFEILQLLNREKCIINYHVIMSIELHG